MDEALKDILKKDGKDWTPEEQRVVQKAIAKYGRDALKNVRSELRGL